MPVDKWLVSEGKQDNAELRHFILGRFPEPGAPPSPDSAAEVHKVLTE